MYARTFVFYGSLRLRSAVCLFFVLFTQSPSLVAQCSSGTAAIIYVDAGAVPGGDGLTWTTAFTNLQDALAEAQHCPDVTEIWVAAGTYYPDEGAATPMMTVLPPLSCKMV